VIHLTRIAHSGCSELHLCLQCATGAAKMNQQKAKVHSAISQTIASQLDGAGELPARCEGCGYTVEDIRKTGRMGCARCYRTFEQLIGPTINALRRAADAMPGVPREPAAKESNEDVIRSLREQMRQAVSREEYETAARLRDRIKALEAQ
jgi:protein arginine kinase activator